MNNSNKIFYIRLKEKCIFVVFNVIFYIEKILLMIFNMNLFYMVVYKGKNFLYIRLIIKI